ncbi:M56 family metallopeptidase [Allosphingosinicella flava]|uniref:M56 family metallopeptidase n=1 Tax=Allosphingosinicella flava TaxID=2771430 RepID=A0A7T2GI08_9SPHN|nr:M56 family metallopeptidase [Sphingosinicella flava]QPQ54201.1 M56 family metallopeptidase [Sphingosinicella flava]
MSFDFLIEMGWKSALIAGIALVAGLVLKSRSPGDRAAILRLAVGLILLLPLISLAGPALQMENPIATAEMAPVIAQSDAADLSALPATAPAPSSLPDNPGFLIGLAYLAGLLLLGLRLASGYVTLQRWTWAAREVDSPVWREALERARASAGDKRGTRLLLSSSVPAPLSWGWAQPVILIDNETYERPDDAYAVLAHEMAHVVRADWVALMLSRLAVAFFWFNPLIWYLEREMVQQSEEAADAQAVAEVEPAHYAQTLMSCIMHSRGGMVPANSIRPSRSGLSRRIYAVLDGRGRAIRSGSKWTLAAMIGCAALAAPLAALELVAPTPPAPPEAPLAPAPAVATLGSAPVAAPAPAAAPRPVDPVPSAGEIRDDIARARAEARHAREQAQIARDRDLRDLDKELAGLDETIAREMRGSMAHARGAAAHAVDGRAIAAAVQKEVRHSMAMSSRDMEKAARDMENGARDMEREADRLRDARYREQQIAKAAAEGKTVTHQDLLNAIPKMKNGAQGMRKGARKMREGAQKMREGA